MRPSEKQVTSETAERSTQQPDAPQGLGALTANSGTVTVFRPAKYS